MSDEPRTSELFRNADFLFFVTGRTVNVVASQALTVAIGWHVYEMTGDPLDLGLIGLVQFLPALILILAAGLAADRLDRRRILAVAALAHAVTVLALIEAVAAQSINWIFALLAIHGAARAFYHTASQPLLPQLVSKELFPNAIAFSSVLNKAAQLVGPLAAGFVLAWIDQDVYWPILALFLAAALCASLIGKLDASGRDRGRVTLESLLGGFAYVWKKKLVLGAISIDLVAVMFGGVMGLLPAYAKDILHVGPVELGWLRAMPGMGSITLGIALAIIPSPRYMGPLMFASLGLFGVAVCVFSVSEVLWLSLAALFAYGAGDMISVYVRQTVVQIATPDAMRGRVSAVNSISINASNELGDFRAGLMAAAIGTVPAVLIGGVVTCAATVGWAFLFPDLRKVDRVKDVKP